jgi:hypothetical protein
MNMEQLKSRPELGKEIGYKGPFHTNLRRKQTEENLARRPSS